MRKEYWALIFILIIASFFRLANISTTPPGLYPDEAMNGNNAVEALEAGEFKIFYTENGGREGLYPNIQSFFISQIGRTPWALRIPSAIFGILTVLGVYFLSKELFRNNSRLALLASFLTATSFWHIIFSRIGFRAIMAPFFMVWAAYFLFLSFKHFKDNTQYKWLIYSAVSGLLLGLGFHSYIAFRIMPFAFLALIPFHLKNPKFYASAAIFAVFTVIAFAPLGLYFIENPADFFGRTSQISVFDSAFPIKEIAINSIKTLGMFHFVGDFNWRHNLAGRPELFWPVGIMLAIGLIDGLTKIFRRFTGHKSSHVEPYIFLFAWLAVAALPIVISNEGIPHALRAILMIPPIFILSASGGMILFKFAEKKIRSKEIVRWVSLAILAFLVFEAYQTYFTRWAQAPETANAFNQNYVSLAEEINSLPQTEEKVVIVNAGGFIVRGIPAPAQTVMYLTDSFTEAGQKENHIRYLTPEEADSIQISKEASVFTID